MDTFNHIKTLITIILGLSITHLLKGVAKFIQHPHRDKPYWLHLAWVFYIFMLLVHFWWWEYRLTHVPHWTFTSYFFIIFFIMTFYSLCALLFPDDIKDYKGYEDYFFSRKKWFFAILAFSYLLDIGDTLIKGQDYLKSLSIEYPIRNAVHIILCLLAIQINNRVFNATLVILFILYELSYIFRLFDTV